MNRLELAAMRERYGYSLRELGDACGLSHQYIYLIEDGERVFSPELAQQIMKGMYQLSMERAATRAAESETANEQPAKNNPDRRGRKKAVEPRASAD